MKESFLSHANKVLFLLLCNVVGAFTIMSLCLTLAGYCLFLAEGHGGYLKKMVYFVEYSDSKNHPLNKPDKKMKILKDGYVSYAFINQGDVIFEVEKLR